MVIHVERIGIQTDLRESAREVALSFPVCCRPVAIEQSGVGQHVGSQTQAHDAGASGVSAAQGRDKFGRRRCGGIVPARNDHDIGVLQYLQPV